MASVTLLFGAVPSWVPSLLNLVLALASVFLIILVLIQRGKGGGLAGAFGGTGGSSAFGSRAGDMFTRVTIYVAAVWILLIMFLIKMVQPIAPLPSNRPGIEAPMPPGPATAKVERPTGARTISRGVRALRLVLFPRSRASEVVVLYSMTGYGEASYSSDHLQVAVELRAVNNRYLKVSLRAAEPYNLLEPEFEKVVRRIVKRGTIQVHLRCVRQFAAQDFQINAVALRSYLEQLRSISGQLALHDGGQSLLSQILALPGVVPEPASAALNLEEDWPVLERVLEQGLARLQAMRQEEGRAMAQELLQLRDGIGTQLALIRKRIPSVASGYRDRMLERVRVLLSELDVEIDRKDLIKEVAIFAERADISEEVVRLASHLDQFVEIVNEPESAGRKLEFLTQEMFRETNTIGSKASDVDISRNVVEIKGALEKIRELVQNVE